MATRQGANKSTVGSLSATLRSASPGSHDEGAESVLPYFAAVDTLSSPTLSTTHTHPHINTPPTHTHTPTHTLGAEPGRGTESSA